MKVQLSFKEINGMIPVMSHLLQEKLPYDISYQLYQMGKTMDEANDYFVKHYKEIQESESDTKNDEVNKLAETRVELTVDKLEKESFFNALKAANANISAADILMLSKIVENDVEEGGFTILE